MDTSATSKQPDDGGSSGDGLNLHPQQIDKSPAPSLEQTRITMQRDPHRPILYMDPWCDACRSVHWLCLEADIPIYFRPTWLWRGDNRKTAYVEKVNPRHQVPALQHTLKNGEVFLLSECHAILQYLCELHGPRVYGEWFGANEYERALITQYLSWHHMALKKTLMRDCIIPIYYRFYWLGTKFIKRPSDNEISKMRSSSHEHLLQLNDFLQGKKFLVNNRITVADLVLAPTIVPVMHLDTESEKLLAEFPNVRAWLERLQEREACKIAHYGMTIGAPQLKEHYKTQSDEPGDFNMAFAWEEKFKAQVVHL